MRQGELSDPLYFDFIAFAQYATICAAFGAAPQVFQVRAVGACQSRLLHDSALPELDVWAKGMGAVAGGWIDVMSKNAVQYTEGARRTLCPASCMRYTALSAAFSARCSSPLM